MAAAVPRCGGFVSLGLADLHRLGRISPHFTGGPPRESRTIILPTRTTKVLRCTLLGVGAMRSPRYRPAGLLVEYRSCRVMLDGGPGSVPSGHLDAWLVTDSRAELISKIRRLAASLRCEVGVQSITCGELRIVPLPVVHTSHPTFGYLLRAPGGTVAWAPEFLRFPRWAAGADLLFAEGASWDRPIWFVGKVGGHAPVTEVAREAKALRVRRLVFSHLGRPTLRALDAGLVPPFGEIGIERAQFALGLSGRVRCSLPEG